MDSPRTQIYNTHRLVYIRRPACDGSPPLLDFEFPENQRPFVEDVIAFLDANDDPDVTREDMAQIVESPAPRCAWAPKRRR